MEIIPGVAALAIAVIYYSWRAYHQALLKRNRLVSKRVAHLLWVLATQEDSQVPWTDFFPKGRKGQNCG
jgi:hypothetical protein